jgi:hypothetical protein
LLVNLINRGAGEALSPTRVMTDEGPPVENAVVLVHQEQRPKSVSVVPADRQIDWSYANGLVTIKVPCLEIHSVLVID